MYLALSHRVDLTGELCAIITMGPAKLSQVRENNDPTEAQSCQIIQIGEPFRWPPD